MSEEQEERIGIDNNRDFELSSDITEPVETIREEVAEKPNTETFPLSSKEEGKEEQKNEIKTDNGDIHEQLKAQSIQLSSLAGMVESLQSQVKQLQETIRLHKHYKTSSVRKKSTSTNAKKKTKRRGSVSRKK